MKRNRFEIIKTFFTLFVGLQKPTQSFISIKRSLFVNTLSGTIKKFTPLALKVSLLLSGFKKNLKMSAAVEMRETFDIRSKLSKSTQALNTKKLRKMFLKE